MSDPAELKLYASSAHRIVSCTASPKRIVAQPQLPPDPEREQARLDGIQAHALAERTLLGEKPTKAEFKDAEMQRGVKAYTDYVRKHTGELLVEQRVDLTDWGFDPAIADAIVIALDGTAHVFDFKYGEGQPVRAFENWQLIAGALGVLKALEFIYTIDTYALHIVQPRVGDGEPSRWDVSRGDLLRYGETLLAAADEARSGKGLFVPGPACEGCPATGDCSALALHTIKQTLTEDMETRDADGIPLEQLGALWELKDASSAFFRGVYARMLNSMSSGDHIAGFKRVQSEKNRELRDPDEFIKSARAIPGVTKKSLYSDPALKSPAQLEKIKGKASPLGALVKQHTVRELGTPKIVPDTHPGEDIDSEQHVAKGFEPTTTEQQ